MSDVLLANAKLRREILRSRPLGTRLKDFILGGLLGFRPEDAGMEVKIVDGFLVRKSKGLGLEAGQKQYEIIDLTKSKITYSSKNRCFVFDGKVKISACYDDQNPFTDGICEHGRMKVTVFDWYNPTLKSCLDKELIRYNVLDRCFYDSNK